MFAHGTKEAIKTGVALSLTLMAAHWLGWQNVSWAILTVMMLSVTDVYGYSALKAQNRIFGTFLGAITAFVILSLFSQDRFWFFASLLSVLAFCTYKSFDARRGYFYSVTNIVCLIILSAGISNGAAGFETAILRLQETSLGTVIFTLVYRLLWPVTTEKEFYHVATKTLDELEVSCANQGLMTEVKNAQIEKNIALLDDLLSLPSTNKTELVAIKHELQSFTNGLKYIHNQLQKHPLEGAPQTAKQVDTLFKHLRNVLAETASPSLACIKELPIQTPERRNLVLVSKRIKGVAVSLSVSTTGIAMWILLPVPDGSVFIIWSCIIALMAALTPPKLVTPIMLVFLLFSSVVLLQYVFVFPQLTESWQLASLFFANIIVSYKALELTHLSQLKVLVGSALVNMTGSAVDLTPNYNIESPLMMLVFVFVILALVRFYSSLFENFPNNLRKVTQ
ncbi:FUSC family protein [Vibrio parahaemolyticus]|uniref:FUSC family protein n=1 Tax=Vibrio mediterranei TaxID=689 RepID=UPI004067B3A0